MGLFGPSKLDRQISDSMKNIQGMQLAPEMRAAYNQSQMLANQGMDAASKQLAIQEQNRGLTAGLGALRSRRSILAGASGLLGNANDMALKLAAQDAMMRRENQMAGIQTGMQFGQAQTELQRYKAEQQYNELSAKKARRAQTLSGIIGAVGSIGGALLGGAGAAGGLSNMFGKGAKGLARQAARQAARQTAANVAAGAASSLFTSGDTGMGIMGSNYGNFK